MYHLFVIEVYPGSWNVCVAFRDHCRYENESAERKQKGEQDDFAKGHIPYGTYAAICHEFATEQFSSNSVFAWAFTVIMFNLFCRGDNVAKLNLKAFYVAHDAICVDFTKTKADQPGRKDLKLNLFPNPFQPEICPVLAVALMLTQLTQKKQVLRYYCTALCW